MAKKPVNIEDYIPTPSTGQLKSVEEPVNKAVSLALQIESLEEAISQLKAEHQVLVTKVIPEAMASAGCESFTSTKGAKVALKRFLNGSLPRDPVKRAEALDWIRAQRAEDLIKFGISVEIDKGDKVAADKVGSALRKIGIPFSSKLDIHPQTLAAFARERMEKGEPVPLETLGLFAGTVAKIDMKKAATPAPMRSEEVTIPYLNPPVTQAKKAPSAAPTRNPPRSKVAAAVAAPAATKRSRR